MIEYVWIFGFDFWGPHGRGTCQNDLKPNRRKKTCDQSVRTQLRAFGNAKKVPLFKVALGKKIGFAFPKEWRTQGTGQNMTEYCVCVYIHTHILVIVESVVLNKIWALLFQYG